jgi:hypothetical protein
VILGKNGMSVYEIPAEKEKLPVDDWVNVEDLGVEDNTHPKDVSPVEMTTRSHGRRSGLPAMSSG